MVDFGAPGDVTRPKPRAGRTLNPGPVRFAASGPGRLLSRVVPQPVTSLAHFGAPASTNARGQAVLLSARRGLITKHYIAQGAIWWGIKVPWYGMRYGMAHAPKVHGIASAARSRQVRCALRCMWCGHAALFQLRRCANAQPVMLHACAVMATRWPCAVMARRSWRCGHGVPWLRRESAVLAARAI